MSNFKEYILLNYTKRNASWTWKSCNTVHDRDFDTNINIKNQDLKMLSDSGTESGVKQKQNKALPLLGKSMTSEIYPTTAKLSWVGSSCENNKGKEI